MKHIIITLLAFTLFVGAKAQFKTQTEIIKDYSNGTLDVFKNDNGKMVSSGKPWPIEFVKNAKGQVESINIKRAGVIDIIYTPDLLEQPGYFKTDANNIVFLEGYIACYTKKMNELGKSYYTILYTFTQGGKSPASADEISKQIHEYYEKSVNAQGAKREEIAKEREAKEKADRELYNLPGKNVKSIEIKPVNIPSGIGNGSTVEFGVIATLVDGSQIKTKNLGGNAEFVHSYKVEAPGCTFADGILSIGKNASLFPNDEIKVTFTGLDAKKTSASYTIKLDYKNSISYSFIGNAGSSGNWGKDGSSRDCSKAAGGNGTRGQDGFDGPSFTLKVQESTVKHSGARVYLVELTSEALQETEYLKISPTGGKINIHSMGGWGGSGGSGGSPGNKDCPYAVRGDGADGGRGGNGGNVYIIKNSSGISGSFVSASLPGNLGGYGGKGKTSGNKGADGVTGKVIERVENFRLNW